MSCACVTVAGHARRRASRRRSVTYSGRTPSGQRRRGRAGRRAPRADARWPATSRPSRRLERRQEVHARRADEVADEGVLRPVEQLRGAADLHRPAARHHHHLVGEGQRLDLVVRDVDQGELELLVDLLELAPQLPLEVRVDHRQRLVEQHRGDVLAHQAAAERDLLLGVGGEAGGALVELAAQLQHLGDLADAPRDRAPARRRGCAAGTRGSRPPSSCRR